MGSALFLPYLFVSSAVEVKVERGLRTRLDASQRGEENPSGGRVSPMKQGAPRLMPTATLPMAAGFSLGVMRRAWAASAATTTAATLGSSATLAALPATPAKVGFASRSCGRVSFVIEAIEFELRNRGLNKSFDAADVIGFLRSHECESIAHGGGAAGATDAMHVIVRRHRDIVIDDVGHAGDIDAAGGDVGRDHHFVLTVFETLEGGGALTLTAVAVQHGDCVAGFLEAQGDFVGAMFGARENEDAVEIGFFQQGDEEGEF